MTRAVKARKMPSTVCFRLPEHHQAELCSRAREDGISHGELARRVLVDYLEDSVRTRLESDLIALQEEVSFLRGDLATLTEALLVLVSHGATVTPMESRTWVEERLRQARKSS